MKALSVGAEGGEGKGERLFGFVWAFDQGEVQVVHVTPCHV